MHRSAAGHADVHSLVERAFIREGVRALAVGSCDEALHRPHARLCARRPQPAGIAAGQRQQVGGAQKVVILHAFRERRHQLAFGRYVRRPFQLLLDAISHGNFLGVQLQAGELLVGLADHLLQTLVARAQAVGFLLQRIIVGHFPRHAGIAGDETEHRETT